MIPKRRRTICLLALYLSLMPMAQAITPVTPRLTNETYQELDVKVRNLGYLENEHYGLNSSISSVLGFKPAFRRDEFKTTHPKAPIINAEAIPFDADCATVFVRATFTHPTKRQLSLEGLYCLQDMARWQAKYQKIEDIPVK